MFILVVYFLAGTSLCIGGRIPTDERMHGDLCQRLDGRKYYLEDDHQATIYVSNLTYPPATYVQIRSRAHPYTSTRSRHRRSFIHRTDEGLDERNSGTTSDASSEFSLISSSTPDTISSMVPFSTQSTLISSSPNLILKDDNATEIPLKKAELPQLSNEMEPIKTVMSKEHYRCDVKFFTCFQCHLEFEFTEVNLPSCSSDGSCRCDFLRITEPPYMDVGGRDVCNGTETQKRLQPLITLTRDAVVDFSFSKPHEKAFVMSVKAKRNKYHLHEEIDHKSGYITTPFFPELYPNEYWMEYHIECKSNRSRVKITFFDFQISSWSFVEIQDTNKSRVAAFNGNIFRPPVLISSGKSLHIRFSANGETGPGFKLKYDFIDMSSKDKQVTPITDCGGFVTNFGGVITMMNMTRPNSTAIFDCIWIIKPPQDYAFKSHISVRVVQLENMGPGTELEIRQGTTSKDYLLEKTSGDNSLTQGTEHVTTLDTGFYVRLRGPFQRNSKVAIVYTAFSYLGNCYALTDLLCHNHRCIPKMLRCNGFDNCGDDSDEPASCNPGLMAGKDLSPKDAIWWYDNTPNYYFPPKNSMFGNSQGSGMFLLISLFALVMVVVGLLSYMFKQNLHERRPHHQNDRRANAATFNDGVEVFDASPDDPPLYEPPPDYEEVLKLILSGNNLKLVRKPGGVTTWVHDESRISAPCTSEASQREQETPIRKKRTRHSSLDLAEAIDVVIWNSEADNKSMNTTEFPTRRTIPSPPQIPAHVRRTFRSLAGKNDVVNNRFSIENDIRGSSDEDSDAGNNSMEPVAPIENISENKSLEESQNIEQSLPPSYDAVVQNDEEVLEEIKTTPAPFMRDSMKRTSMAIRIKEARQKFLTMEKDRFAKNKLTATSTCKIVKPTNASEKSATCHQSIVLESNQKEAESYSSFSVPIDTNDSGKSEHESTAHSTIDNVPSTSHQLFMDKTVPNTDLPSTNISDNTKAFDSIIPTNSNMSWSKTLGKRLSFKESRSDSTEYLIESDSYSEEEKEIEEKHEEV